VKLCRVQRKVRWRSGNLNYGIRRQDSNLQFHHSVAAWPHVQNASAQTHSQRGKCAGCGAEKRRGDGGYKSRKCETPHLAGLQGGSVIEPS
jgi:hypothetical protein